jgi:hypothetical protein
MIEVINKEKIERQAIISGENINAKFASETAAEFHSDKVLIVTLPNSTREFGNPIGSAFTPNTKYYNLFVVGSEAFDDKHFTIPKNKALIESVAPELKSRYSTLNAEAIEKIKTFPTIFASENHGQAKTDNEHQAFFGFVTDVKIQDNGIKICFWLLSAIPQQKLNENASIFGIAGASMSNELNRTHWSIKEIDLIQQLKTINVSVLAPT